jgi:hypothetical protein
LSLTVLLINLALGSTAFASTNNEEKAGKQAEKVKESIVKLGIGKHARVEVKLNDGTRVNGYVSEIAENGFAVMDETTAVSRQVPYPTVKQVKGHNWSTGVKIAIGVGLVVVVLVVLGFLTRSA